MKRLFALLLALLLLTPAALADDPGQTVNRELFEALYAIYAEFYAVPALPTPTEINGNYYYRSSDMSLILTFFESGNIDLISLSFDRPLTFDRIALAACVWASAYGKSMYDPLMSLVFEYRNGTENPFVVFNDRTCCAMISLSDPEKITFAISAHIPGQN